jgi:hypothetical protein
VSGLAGRYFEAMRKGQERVCARIEQDAGLWGYPPELVSVGLYAIDEGRDGPLAVLDYINSKDVA